MLTNTEKLVMAIKLLRPSAEFSLVGGDYSSITWDSLEGKAPTATEVTNAITQIETEIANKEAAQSAAAASAVAKLEAIGLTSEEIAALRG